MRYTGGKSAAGTWQRIVNLLPPHRTFVELFAGGAAIARLKRPAEDTVLVEKDAAQCARLRAEFGDAARVIRGDGIGFAQYFNDAETLIYADPPYLLSTRNGRRYYPCELEDADHVELLTALKASRCKVVLSGYRSALYDAAGFSDHPPAPWRFETFRVMTRGGKRSAMECLWYNFARPVVPHDTGHAGENFRERWRIEKKRQRWRRKFAAMPPAERASIFTVLHEHMATAGA